MGRSAVRIWAASCRTCNLRSRKSHSSSGHAEVSLHGAKLCVPMSVAEFETPGSTDAAPTRAGLSTRQIIFGSLVGLMIGTMLTFGLATRTGSASTLVHFAPPFTDASSVPDSIRVLPASSITALPNRRFPPRRRPLGCSSTIQHFERRGSDTRYWQQQFPRHRCRP